MSSALIGYTGFVGSNIVGQHPFDDLYNSGNIEEIRGKEYELLVSAGTKGARYVANQDPEGDWAGIKRLLDALEGVKVGHFVLVSTVDVYPNPVGVDEDTAINEGELTQAYGKNRFALEKFVRERFLSATIVRCPQLYGNNLKKNFVFDLIHDNALDWTHKDTTLQLYHLKNMWKDIQTAMERGLPLINFAVEPVTAAELAKYARDMEFTTVTEGKPPLKFDFQTKHAQDYGKEGRYLYTKAETLDELRAFIQEGIRNKGKER